MQRVQAVARSEAPFYYVLAGIRWQAELAPNPLFGLAQVLAPQFQYCRLAAVLCCAAACRKRQPKAG